MWLVNTHRAPGTVVPNVVVIPAMQCLVVRELRIAAIAAAAAIQYSTSITCMEKCSKLTPGKLEKVPLPASKSSIGIPSRWQ